MTTIDIDNFKKYKSQGLIRVQKCKKTGLLIWNYTDKTIFKRQWDPITNICRALITDEKGNIIAKSFNKFHNIEENLHKPSPEFSVYEKIDGSLGVLFYYNGNWIITSRGSFTSEQSVEASKMLKGKDLTKLNKEYTYSFEIIYPENKIVVDYKDTRDLVFIGAFKTDSTEVTDEVIDSVRSAGFPIVKKYEFDDYNTIKNLNTQNAEGFIVKFHGTGDRVKIKFENYINLHKFATKLNEKSVWEIYSKGLPLEEAITGIPDEFFDWFKEEWAKLNTKFHEIKNECLNFIEKYKNISTRKEFAQTVYNHKFFNIIMNMYSNKFEDNHIYSYLKPSSKPDKCVNSTTVNSSTVDSLTVEPKTVVKEIRVMIGISGSGKSTYAQGIVQNNSTAVRVNRDTLRMQLYGYTEETLSNYYKRTDLNKLEEIITKAEYCLIESFLKDKNIQLIIIDDTNLQKTYIKKFYTTYPGYKFTFKLMDTPFEECVKRNATRNKAVDKSVLNDQLKKLKLLKKNFDFNPIGPVITKVFVQNKELPKAVVCDLDGTLCLMYNRGAHEYHKVKDDKICEQVKSVLEMAKLAGYKIIIVTGRPKKAEKDSKKWLVNHCITYDSFYCRQNNDFRKDFLIKQEIWEEIVSKYYIEFMLDDRDQVVNHARTCGFKVFQVEPGNF